MTTTKKYIIAIVIISAIIAGLTAVMAAGAVPKNPKPVDYIVYVYDNGAATIEIDNINKVIQTHEDIIAGDMELKAGTLILAGNGNEIYYDYPRRQSIDLK